MEAEVDAEMEAEVPAEIEAEWQAEVQEEAKAHLPHCVWFEKSLLIKALWHPARLSIIF